MNLFEKKSRVFEIECQLKILSEERAQLIREITDTEAPYKVGDIINWKYGKSRRYGRITKIRKWCSDYEYHVIPILKNGKDGFFVLVYGSYMDIKAGPLEAKP